MYLVSRLIPVGLGVALAACGPPAIVSTTVASPTCVADAPGAPEGTPFSVSKAQTAMNEAARAAGHCPAAKDTTVTVKALVTFSASGCASGVTVQLPEGSLSSDAVACIETAFLAARINPYAGVPVTVGKAFTVTP